MTMKNAAFWLLLFLVAGICSIASASPILEWSTTFSGPGANVDMAYNVAVHTDGSVYVVGLSDDPDLDPRLLLARYDKDGNELWAVRQVLPNDNNSIGYDLALDSLGNVYAVGHATFDQYQAGLLVKYDPDGQELWQVFYDGGEPGDDGFNAMKIDESGQINVVGFTSLVIVAPPRFLAVRYDTDGNIIWEGFDPNAGGSFANDLVLDSERNLYLVGTGGTDVGISSFVVMAKFDPDGNYLWSEEVIGNGLGESFGNSVTLDSSIGYFFSGSTQQDVTRSDLTLNRSTRTGTSAWGTIYAGPPGYEDQPPAAFGPFRFGYGKRNIVVDEQDNVYMVGGTGEIQNDKDVVLLKFDGQGRLLWEEVFDSGQAEDDLPAELLMGQDGTIWIAGQGSAKAGDSDLLLLGYNSDGTLAEEVHFNLSQAGEDQGNAIAFDPDGNLVLAGKGFSSLTGSDAVTVKFCLGCLIENQCIVAGSEHPDQPCLVCDPARSQGGWSDFDGNVCDDAVFCNGEDQCQGGSCSVHAGDPCPEGYSCDVQVDSCAESEDDDPGDDDTGNGDSATGDENDEGSCCG
jgi:hypothetical protein